MPAVLLGFQWRLGSRKTMESRELIFHEKPDLTQPWLILGYKGWIDAGYVSSGTVTFLTRKLRARKFAEILSDGFYQFRDLRPEVVVEGGLIRHMEFPTNEFFYWKNSSGLPDLILFLGHEPHLRWRAFTDLLLQLASQLGAQRLVIIGGLYDQVPHTITRRVSVVASNSRLLGELLAHGVELIDYAGPGGQVSLLSQTAETRGIGSFMLWGRVPYYLQMRSPRDSFAILRLLSRLIPLEINLRELEEDAILTDEQIQQVIEQKPELRSHIKQLESIQGQKAMEQAPPSDPVIIEAVITRNDLGDKKKE
jgi:proteasome assembly chaperone (PAC2) family protein